MDLHTLDDKVRAIERRVRRARAYVIVAFVVVIGAYATNFAVRLGMSVGGGTGEWGEFGDFVGGLLNPVVALFAFYWLTEQVRLTAEVIRLERSESRRIRTADRFAVLYDELNTSAFGEEMETVGRWLNLLARSMQKGRTSLTEDEIAAAYKQYILDLDAMGKNTKKSDVERARRRVKSWYVKCLLYLEADDLSREQLFDLITRDRASLMLHVFAMTRGQTAASKHAAGATAGSPSSDARYFRALEEMVSVHYGVLATVAAVSGVQG